MKKPSLLIQLVLSFFVVVIGFLGLIGVTYYQTTSQAITEVTVQATQNSIKQGGEFVHSYLQKLQQTSSSLVVNPTLRAYIESPTTANKQNFVQMMQTLLEADRDLVAATLVTRSGEVISTDTELDMKTSSDMMKESWYQKAIEDEAMMPVLTPARLTQFANHKEEWIISVTQEVSDANGQNLGVLRLDIGYETLETYLDKLELGSTGFTFIINDQHQFVYHPENKVYSSQVEMDRLKPYIAVKNGFSDNHEKYIYQYKIPDSNWTVIGVASLNGLHTLQSKILSSFVGLGIVSLIVCCLSIWFILKRWISPLKHLQQVILKVGQGDSNIRAQEVGAVELVDLSRQFNTMLDQINVLMTEIKQNEQSIRQYELQALASQINPHFLYNTLDTIVWMAEFNDSQRVVDLTKALAKFFRLALNNGNELISLKDEIDHVRQYLFIQEQRYGEKLQYDIEELAKYDRFTLPKLILQPIVENAIYHGIKPVDRPGKIRLTVSEADQHIKVTIFDNGKGFSQDQSAVKSMLSSGVGLQNVDQRLSLFFGEDYQMTIQSEEDRYTKINLFFPKG
ncbi:cache domain-containing sensor histidine kinase [Streptococcus merionis]|uniref:Putative histidine kinase n=1 Tax=Streptococcus merionis TaxID=400065 RepID=A0A239SS29_9STRE|nr:sensor histidine kinase [Streptococcus merionis]SNU87638.1 putative histidine kinase [Streptococcus merionis]